MKKKKVVIDRWLRPYVGFTLRSAATRKHSLDILACPSRMGSKLYYPNGEVSDVYRRPDQTDC
jgi:hypothetical protein